MQDYTKLPTFILRTCNTAKCPLFARWSINDKQSLCKVGLIMSPVTHIKTTAVQVTYTPNTDKHKYVHLKHLWRILSIYNIVQSVTPILHQCSPTSLILTSIIRTSRLSEYVSTDRAIMSIYSVMPYLVI